MNHTEFNQVIDEARAKHPLWFKLSEDNEKVSLNELEKIEAQVGVEYPEEYKRFISKYGVGEFAFTNVYSPKLKGEWSSWEEKEKYKLPSEFIPISDNGCGDYLGFMVSNGKCSKGLYWADHQQGYMVSGAVTYENFYCFIIKLGLNT